MTDRLTSRRAASAVTPRFSADLSIRSFTAVGQPETLFDRLTGSIIEDVEKPGEHLVLRPSMTCISGPGRESAKRSTSSLD